ncbi:hypothetical protein PFLUV_G00161690 [Perca fluviatilis]|uniref:CCT-gamma n=2 Tax=Perca fluviatilis TaxID=8168 RepID=A0A6A5F449_PERFL|nr:hypothetical protein PFLUV_G00161690 [Perca fluviatilis]
MKKEIRTGGKEILEGPGDPGGQGDPGCGAQGDPGAGGGPWGQQGDPGCKYLGGASKEILAEVERNLQDAMQVCRNVLLDPFLLPGGGAIEMAVSKRLMERSRALTGIEQWPYRAVATALEVVPRTLIQNCGASTIRVLTSLRAKHTQENSVNWGVDGETGCLADMMELGIWEPLAVKAQTYKTAMETAILLLRIDDIVSGHKKKDKDEQMGGQGAE